MIAKIISGGQTGVDRAALDFAIERKIPHGGYCPKGRRSESGRISDKYTLTETTSSDYGQRRVMNVRCSDGTLIMTRGSVSGGTRKTVHDCVRHGKPKFVVNLQHRLKIEEFGEWVRANNIRILNVAGPRESKQSGIGKQAYKALVEFLVTLTPQASA